jgi:maleylpyruvate isomerase
MAAMSDAPHAPVVAPLDPSERRRALAGVAASHRRLLDELASLTDDGARSPSNLPGWRVGHVLTHIARNADSFRGIADAVARGEVLDQYPGGHEQRSTGIDAGADRAAGELVEDVRASAAALEAAWEVLSEDQWATGLGRTIAWGEVPVSYTLLSRWREVEVHRIDLGLGATWASVSPDYLTLELPRVLAQVPALLERRDDGRDVARSLVAALVGRGSGPVDLPSVFG